MTLIMFTVMTRVKNDERIPNDNAKTYYEFSPE